MTQWNVAVDRIKRSTGGSGIGSSRSCTRNSTRSSARRARACSIDRRRAVERDDGSLPAASGAARASPDRSHNPRRGRARHPARSSHPTDLDAPTRHRDRESVVGVGVPVPGHGPARLPQRGRRGERRGVSARRSFVTLISDAYYIGRHGRAHHGGCRPAGARRLGGAAPAWPAGNSLAGCGANPPRHQPDALRGAAHRGDAGPRIAAGQLAAYEHVQKPTMTRTVKRCSMGAWSSASRTPWTAA